MTEGTEGLGDDEGRINLAEDRELLFKGSGPVGMKDRINLSVHVVVVFISTVAVEQSFPILHLAG